MNEEQIIREEEFTTCDIHPDVVFEIFTDCPKCMDEEWFQEADEETS